MTVDTLETIAAEVASCQACGLCKGRKHAVPGEGHSRPDVMFIGEGPGYYEDEAGRPFVGAAGQLLNEMIATIGFQRPDVFITNVVRCRPPGNRDPLPEELAACDTFTVRQIDLLQPKLIVTLGRYSMARFFGPGRRITDIHGQTSTWNGIRCLAMYHPAAVLRAGATMRHAYEEDFRKIPALVQSVASPPPVAKAPAEQLSLL